jgi:hypothetical protein
MVCLDLKEMTDLYKLNIVKIIHTMIWVFYNVVIFYMIYAVLLGGIGLRFWICCGLVLLEGIILLLFRWTCPLTLIARRYTDSDRDNFDIYLPEWLARHTKTIYTVITILIFLAVAFRFLLSV